MTERERAAGVIARLQDAIQESRERYDAHASECARCQDIEKGPWCAAGSTRRAAWCAAQASKRGYARRMARRIAF